jgi:Ca-activated chloride channel family protein
MDRRFGLALILVIFALAGLVGPAQADGIIIPEPCRGDLCPPPMPPCVPGKSCPPLPHPIAQLAVKYHRVTVKIDRQVAVTHVDQVFYNPNTWAVEGTYTFPLPAEAAVSQFTLWVDGKPVEGKVLNAQEARQYYEETVRQQKDPALLEYIGRGAVQARVFPIPSKGERRIELEYSQVLSAENGLVRYVYPLNTEKFSSAPLDSVSVSVEIRSDQPLRAIYSPSHPVGVNRKDSNNASVGWEATKVRPDQDFTLYYSIGESQALHLLSYRDPKDPLDPDGFFLLLLAPRPTPLEDLIAKDVIVVLDRSGSMEGEKFRQAQTALRYILQHLNPGDRFGLETFSTSVEPYARGLRPSDEANEATAWVDRLSAAGSTDINRALLEALAMADKERPTYLIFLTDGLPTMGETKRENIIKNFTAAAPKNVRLFAFGVGYDVDTFLLDTLSQQQHGLSSYVRPGEKLDEIVSGFYEKISTPVLTDLSLDFGKLNVSDLYPSPLPDLFVGSQVVVVGRYRQGATIDLTLKGTINGQVQTFSFPGQVFAEDTRGAGAELASLPRLWATRKIGYLLNLIRLKGTDKETIDQIVKLSIRYGIVTPYTSYLVTEPMPLGAANQERVANDAYKSAQSAPTAAASGRGAVDRSAEQGALSQAQQAAPLPQQTGAGQNTILTVGARTFVLNQEVWTDTAYDPQKMPTIQVAFLSPDYFRLSQSRTDVAAALALGSRVIVVVDGSAYEVIPENGVVPTVSVLPVSPAVTATAPKPATIATSPLPTLASTRPSPTRSESDWRDWLPVAVIGLAVLVAFGISLIAWTRHKS